MRCARSKRASAVSVFGGHVSLRVGGTQVVRLLAKGTSKGAALAALAHDLGVARENTAVAGDWLNDLSMFEYAARSFAMPQAPEQVKQVATDRLHDEDVAARTDRHRVGTLASR